jgi:hypothetical protein
MAVLFDPADDYVRSVLDVAKVHGEISLADLEAICEAVIEAKDSVSTEDIADTIDVLANMGIEVDNSLPPDEQARRDADSGTALAGSVAAAIRFLAKGIMTGTLALKNSSEQPS